MRRQWSRLAPGAVVASYEALRPRLLAVVLTGQARMVAPVGGYVSRVLGQTGQVDDPVAAPTPRAMVGWAGDGRSIEGLVDVAPGKVLDGLRAGLPAAVAVKAGQEFLDLAVTTALWDTVRHAEALEVAVRPGIDGYVRMLNPGVHGACSRCAVLAGRWYRRNTGFARHPRCRCVHIPASEAVAGDYRLNPDDYFGSLTKAEQDRIFTKAGAEAIRNGADPVQVVNARRGMHTAQTNLRGWIPKGRLTPVDRYGRPVYVTTEGVTKRGRAYRGRTGRRGERLMPESILQLADDQDDLMRLLKLHGYLP
ncbi:MAG: hypothetical protein Q4F65_05690 [Propionibacteriaceae bacterium]|nr:hypothetical protein [Propionibacteriaceae bacterium]